MTGSGSQRLGAASCTVIGATIILLVGGVAWYGMNAAVLERLWRQLLERPGGPMSFRFVLQPLMAAVAAVLDGVRDARRGRPPYFRTLLVTPHRRAALLGEALSATARILLLGLIMDLIYQLIVFGTFYPNEAVAVAFVLAFLPYVLIRGPALRLVRRWREHRQGRLR